MNHFCLHVLEISMPSIMLSFLYTITGISYIFHAVLHTTTNEVLTMLYYDFIDLIVFVGIQQPLSQLYNVIREYIFPRKLPSVQIIVQLTSHLYFYIFEFLAFRCVLKDIFLCKIGVLEFFNHNLYVTKIIFASKDTLFHCKLFYFQLLISIFLFSVLLFAIFFSIMIFSFSLFLIGTVACTENINSTVHLLSAALVPFLLLMYSTEIHYHNFHLFFFQQISFRYLML